MATVSTLAIVSTELLHFPPVMHTPAWPTVSCHSIYRIAGIWCSKSLHIPPQCHACNYYSCSTHSTPWPQYHSMAIVYTELLPLWKCSNSVDTMAIDRDTVAMCTGGKYCNSVDTNCGHIMHHRLWCPQPIMHNMARQCPWNYSCSRVIKCHCSI